LRLFFTRNKKSRNAISPRSSLDCLFEVETETAGSGGARQFSAVVSAVEAGTGVAIATDLGYSFGNRLEFLHITPEPKPISVIIAALKGRLSPAAEKFWQCAKEAASPDPRAVIDRGYPIRIMSSSRKPTS
jgi:DNA-binding transcriptional LysR family regulator